MPYFLPLSRDAQQQMRRASSFWTQLTTLNFKIWLLLFLHQPPFVGPLLLFAASVLIHSSTFHSSCASRVLLPPSSLQLSSYTVAACFLHLHRTPCLATSASNTQYQYLLNSILTSPFMFMCAHTDYVTLIY